MTNDELIDLWREKHKIDRKQAPTLLELMDLCESARIAGLESAKQIALDAECLKWKTFHGGGKMVGFSPMDIATKIHQMIPKESV